MTTTASHPNRKLIGALGNWFMSALLRSPLHGLIDRGTMLITFTGRRSARTFTIAVNYARDGDALVVVSQSHRLWWKNLRGGAPVRVRLQGRELSGCAESSETPKTVAAGMLLMLRQSPALRRHYNIALTGDGQLERPDELDQVARGMVVVRISGLVAEAAPTGN